MLTYSDRDNDKNSSLSDFETDQKTSVGQTFMEHISYMEEAFGSYMKRHDASQRKLGTLITSYPTVNIWLNECRESALNLTSVPELRVLLDRPQQRLIYYRIFLSELAKLAPPLHPDSAAITMALGYVTEMPGRILDMKRRRNVVTRVLAPTKPESGLRAGISKIFNFRTGRSVPEASANLTSTSDDTTYTLSTRELEDKFRDNYFQVQVVIRDFREYERNMRVMLESFSNLVHSFIVPIDTLPSRVTQIFKTWLDTDRYLKGIETGFYRDVSGVTAIYHFLAPW